MEPVLLNYTPSLPRTDYPRPQWKRPEWISLNGEWDFAFDFGKSGLDREMQLGGDFPEKITVPFCPESRLSGLGHTDFIPAVWYRRTFSLSVKEGQRTLLHFGAVDYEARVWVNEIFCGSHKGGYAPFTLDISDAVREGENRIVVYAADDFRNGEQPYGKQCTKYRSAECSYTRTTGIWQTVWLEIVREKYLSHARMIPSARDGKLFLTLFGNGTRSGDYALLQASYLGNPVAETRCTFAGNQAQALLEIPEPHLWEVGNPELYDLTVTLVDGDSGAEKDTVESYFALRDVALSRRALTINGKPVFMRTILDQGFNPEGIYTAPNDDFLRHDIELSMELGFNGARFHQRVFEDRSLYWADKLGYLVWCEYANGEEHASSKGFESFLPEYLEVMEHEFNHPAVIGWCLMNETYHAMELDEMTHRIMYDIVKRLDPSRPVIDASGGMHYDTDMFDVHDYEQDAEKLASYLAPMLEDDNAFHCPIPRYVSVYKPQRPIAYKGQPYWVSEYGGTFWQPHSEGTEEGWGYGDGPKTEEEFAARYESLTHVLLSHPRVCGFCYTQLTDIEQEQNGLYLYDRSRKLPDWVYERIRKANLEKAAIEE